MNLYCIKRMSRPHSLETARLSTPDLECSRHRTCILLFECIGYTCGAATTLNH